jgi:hypothetical protein
VFDTAKEYRVETLIWVRLSLSLPFPKRLDHHNLAGISLGQCARQCVVHTSGCSGQQYGQQDPSQRHLPYNGPEGRHCQQAQQVSALLTRIALNALSGQQANRRCARIAAAPAYSSAAVLKAPNPAPNRCTKGVLMPKSAAASKASSSPLRAGSAIKEVNGGRIT